MTLKYSPYLNSQFLLCISRLAVFLQQGHEEAVREGFGSAGTQTLWEGFQASLRPLSQQRNQSGRGDTKGFE